MRETPELDVQELASIVRELAAAVERLSDEVVTLRQAADDLREETVYELRKLRDELARPPAPYQLTSMPRDPLAPDFEQRVNALNAAVFDTAAETVEMLLERLMADSPAGSLAAEDWVEDQEFAPGAVFEIEPAIFDWFAEYPVTVKQGAEWFAVDDGMGNFFLLWHQGEQCLLRLLTDGEQQAFSRLTGIVPDLPQDDQEDGCPPIPASQPEAAAQQQTLW